jgi:hypothetical protein
VDRVMRENDIDALESTLAGGAPTAAPSHLQHTRNSRHILISLSFHDTFLKRLYCKRLRCPVPERAPMAIAMRTFMASRA